MQPTQEEKCPLCEANSSEEMTEAQLTHILEHGERRGLFKRKGEGWMLTKKGIKDVEERILPRLRK